MALTARGPRVVVTMAAVVVALTAAYGYVVGAIGPDGLQSVTLLGVWTLEPTPVGLAIYGAVTIATIMAVGVALVMVASRFDDADVS